jgi:hypothetical protein
MADIHGNVIQAWRIMHSTTGTIKVRVLTVRASDGYSTLIDLTTDQAVNLADTLKRLVKP